MMCPLCDDEGATAVTDELALVVTCEPCGVYYITWSAADAWVMGGGARTVALELARQHLADLRRRDAEIPRIQAEDVRGWVKPPA